MGKGLFRGDDGLKACKNVGSGLLGLNEGFGPLKL
jgi:hypothetical protein